MSIDTNAINTIITALAEKLTATPSVQTPTPMVKTESVLKAIIFAAPFIAAGAAKIYEKGKQDQRMHDSKMAQEEMDKIKAENKEKRENDLHRAVAELQTGLRSLEITMRSLKDNGN
jgi:4-diphosphocytidyl-2C-methyl-D-erythritol kinase